MSPTTGACANADDAAIDDSNTTPIENDGTRIRNLGLSVAPGHVPAARVWTLPQLQLLGQTVNANPDDANFRTGGGGAGKGELRLAAASTSLSNVELPELF